jgi:hypothetical protein
MKIAVLAWGSLVWDRRKLAITDNFKPCGLHLPIEFCRVSGDGRLTLVVDDALGINCVTYLAVSAFDDLHDAVENLRVREGMPSAKGVGFVDIAAGKHSLRAVQRHPNAVATILAWVNANSFDAAVWTALPSNFSEPEKGGEPFSVRAAIRYLEKLDAPKLDVALSYVRRAPPQVQTPVRAAVNARWPKE